MSAVKDLYSIVTALKTTKRQGWILNGMDSDVIASHIYGAMCIGKYLATQEGVDANKVVQMLLIHDWVMAKMEDVNPLTGKYDQKRAMEEEVKGVIADLLPESMKEEYLSLFSEFNMSQTLESQVAREADKLETLFQGEVFEAASGKNDVLDSFFEPYKSVFKTKLGKDIFNELKQRHLKRKV